ncbi:MAG: hypothetical protein Tsb0013_22910 [Phycisphaerales bacterium]
MDDRQQQVKIGAGLEESRLNQELIDWLNKWGLRILLVVLLVVAGYQGTQLLEARAETARNRVFVNFYDTLTINDAGAMLDYGDEHKDQPGIWELSYVRGGMMLLAEGTSGVRLGAVNRFAPTDEEKLSRDERMQRYARASEVFGALADKVEGDPVKRLMLLQALNGKASAELSLGNADEAKALFERVVEMAQENGYEDIAAFARVRLSNWDDLLTAPAIVSRDEMPVTANPNLPGDFQPIDATRPLQINDPRNDTDATGEEPNVPVQTIPEGEESATGAGDPDGESSGG